MDVNRIVEWMTYLDWQWYEKENFKASFKQSILKLFWNDPIKVDDIKVVSLDYTIFYNSSPKNCLITLSSQQKRLIFLLGLHYRQKFTRQC